LSIAKLVNSQRDPNLVCLASDHTRMRVLRCSKNATSRSWHSDIKPSSQILALNLGNGGMGWLFMLLWVILPFPTFSTSFIKGLNIDDLWKHQPESVFFSYTWKTKGGRVPSTPTIGAGSCSLVRIKYIYIYIIYILYIYYIYRKTPLKRVAKPPAGHQNVRCGAKPFLKSNHGNWKSTHCLMWKSPIQRADTDIYIYNSYNYTYIISFLFIFHCHMFEYPRATQIKLKSVAGRSSSLTRPAGTGEVNVAEFVADFSEWLWTESMLCARNHQKSIRNQWYKSLICSQTSEALFCGSLWEEIFRWLEAVLWWYFKFLSLTFLCFVESKSRNQRDGIWRFPKIGVPRNHPF